MKDREVLVIPYFDWCEPIAMDSAMVRSSQAIEVVISLLSKILWDIEFIELGSDQQSLVKLLL